MSILLIESVYIKMFSWWCFKKYKPFGHCNVHWKLFICLNSINKHTVNKKIDHHDDDDDNDGI